MKSLLKKSSFLRKLAKLRNIYRYLMNNYDDLLATEPKDLVLLKAKMGSLEDSIIYFEYRVDKIHQNIVSYLGKSKDQSSPKILPSQTEVCFVCAGNALPYMQMQGYMYFRCESCGHIFIPSKFEKEFGAEFYNSKKYWTIENTWPKEERIALFKMLLSKMNISDERFRLIDYGCGINDIKEKKEILPNTLFYDPYFNHSDVVNDIKKIPSNAADAILSTEVFEHLFHPNAAMAEISKLLKPGGSAYFTTLISDYKFDINYISPEKGHVSIFCMKSFEIMCKAHGFEWGIETFDADHRYYMHRLVKK